MDIGRAVESWFREHVAVWFLALALLTGALYGGGQFLLGGSTTVALASGVGWGVLWAGGFLVVRGLLSE
ncbi:hypothetical protein [Halomarina oriensis]|uniref:DUF4175 domain-containing protein n=1 Tax=Halomarina oriensis TaxID=671145 RepID=A0A6B0GL64_9EURY|nr:hypothetical protein [Halomarina oriensis]MWG34189.1 hypothetical protein [Halomarina oriensis]